MIDGVLTPGAHDGMAAFPLVKGACRLVRNHEVGAGPDAFIPSPVYDPKAGGGTTTLTFDAHKGELVEARASLSGTVRNCAGGLTPWGSWLTCEETIDQPAATNDLLRPHGYIFEVPAGGDGDPEPFRAMGRFSHEAIAVDPATGMVYETEDAGSTSGFYRFVPNRPADLAAGGRLQMLAIAGRPQYDTRTGQTGDPLPVEWVDIDDPDPTTLPAGSVFAQGSLRGGARFARLEGAWFGNGLVYFDSTSGGNVGQGQIWSYDPRGHILQLVFESPGAAVLNSPDNLCVSPRGGLVLCEDGSGEEFLHGLTADGQIFPFAKNTVVLNGEKNGIVGNFSGSEFAGACDSPDGRWLFFNIQSPGITFAVTGPWGSGAL